MNREEAIAKGWEIKETKNSMKRRYTGHDYRRPGTYMLTVAVSGRRQLLGTLRGDAAAENGTPGAPHVEHSPLGRAVIEEEIRKISQFYPMVEVWKTCVMPDHIHMIVRVKGDMPPGRHLGNVVGGFKTGCNRAYRRLCGIDGPLRQGLFEPGYNDKILMRDGQLDNWKRYLDDNPRRLLIKRGCPQLFTVVHDMTVAGQACRTVGNRFLLDIPDKMAVIVHRRYTDSQYDDLRRQWLACGERGGVLVSAAIAPREKAVLREAMDRGHRIILLRENGFPEMYKPAGESFYSCAKGLLLQISPWEYHTRRRAITRSQCLFLNSMAEKIAGEAKE